MLDKFSKNKISLVNYKFGKEDKFIKTINK